MTVVASKFQAGSDKATELSSLWLDPNLVSFNSAL
jgi:hypothetical protein